MKFKIGILSIVIFALQSCALNGLQKTNRNFKFHKVLSDNAKTYIYRANISLYDNDLSGMIIIKPLEDGDRIVFINEIGMKFFDFEFSENDYKVNQIFEPMNKKMFIKLLVNDFRFILMNNLNENYIKYKNKKSGVVVIKPKSEKELYYFDPLNSLPKKAVRYSILRRTTFLTYDNYMNEIPRKITLKHININFNIEMGFVK